MSEKFVASNGVVVDQWGGGCDLRVGDPLTLMYGIPEGWVDALREFFLHERDTELGRWRDPEVRTRVVTEIDHRRVHVYDEETRCYSEFDDAGPGSVRLLTRGDFGLNDTALRYFSAHPEPKPWMDVPDGIYAVSPQVHPYARLIQKRAGRWLHLYRSSTEGDREPHSAEAIAKSASKEGRLTRLVPEVVSDDS